MSLYIAYMLNNMQFGSQETDWVGGGGGFVARENLEWIQGSRREREQYFIIGPDQPS